jgi:hypothetical protein
MQGKADKEAVMQRNKNANQSVNDHVAQTVNERYET